MAHIASEFRHNSVISMVLVLKTLSFGYSDARGILPGYSRNVLDFDGANLRYNTV